MKPDHRFINKWPDEELQKINKFYTNKNMFCGNGMSSFKYLKIVIKNVQTVSEDENIPTGYYY